MLAHDMIVCLVGQQSADKGCGMVIRRGGTSKSAVIQKVRCTLEQIHGPGSVELIAPTGKAASVIGGSTAHNKTFGLGLPTKGEGLSSLPNADKQQFQEVWKQVELVIMDEFSMFDQIKTTCITWTTDCVSTQESQMKCSVEWQLLCWGTKPRSILLVEMIYGVTNPRLRMDCLEACCTGRTSSMLLNWWK
jgi:hypothetical protein